MKKQFVLGASKAVITPEIGTLLYGYALPIRPACSVNDDLRVNVLTFGYEKATSLMISFDLCSVPSYIAEPLKELLEKETGIKKEQIMTHAIHTHSGPSIANTTGWGKANMDYVEGILIPQTLIAVKEAIKNVQPVLMGVGTIQSDVGVNRREFYEDGNIILGQNKFGVCDKTMTVISFVSTEDKKPVANIVHYGAHPTAAGHDTPITRDWPGYMIDGLERKTGAISLFMNGAEGDVGPRLSNGKTVGNIELMREIGCKAAIDAVEAFNTIKEYSEVTFKTVTDTVKIPFNPLPPLKEMEAERDALGDPSKLERTNLMKYDTLTKRINIYKSGEKIKTHFEFQQVLFSFNSVVFVPFPFEMFTEIVLRLRKFSPKQHTLSTCNTNAALGYMPTQTQLCLGGYEVESFRAFNEYTMVDNADTHIINENVRIIKML